MSGDLLQTKLYLPRLRPSLVPRPRLIETLNHGLAGKLTLISAPAGFGKTTLVSSWIDALQTEKDAPSPPQIAWLSLDENDGELARFLAYVIAALQRVEPHIGESALALLQASPLPVPRVLTTLLNDIAKQPDAFMLVLDDYHAVDSQPIDEALTFLLDNLPPQLHLVVTSREDPNLPLARLRVRGLLTELRAADLRFTVAETAVFLQEVMGLNLTKDQIAALETRTEGWIAGLQMAALSMRGQDDLSGFVQSFTGSHRFVLDYLLEEVLNQQPEEVQTFLLKTAVLNRLAGSLCDALTGDDDGQEMLESLDRANLFLVPLDNERRWYRYHHLFAELLQQRLQQEAEKFDLPELHIRASKWYEDNGLEIDAIQHAAAAKDVERVADLLELAWPTMDRTYQSTAWLGWAKTVPDEIVRTRPVLGMAYAWAFLNEGDMAAADVHLRDVEQRLQQPSPKIVIVDEEQFQWLPATIASARAYHAQMLGDTPGTMKYAQQALDLLPEDDYFKRFPAMMLLGLMYWGQGELDTAYQFVDDAMSIFQKAGQFVFAIGGTFCLASMRIAQGRLQDAVSIYERALQLALAQGDSAIPGTADLYLGLAGLHHERGNVEEVQQSLSKSEALSEEALEAWPYRLRITQAQIKQSQGDMDGAITLLDEAETLYFSTPVPNLRPVSALKTRVWIAQGKLTAALSWEREQGLSVADDLSFLRQFEHITLARLRIAQYKQGGNDNAMLEAMTLLGRLLKAAEEGRWLTSMIEVLLLQAVAHQAQDNLPLARVPLARALTLAEPEGYVRIFVDEGLPMAQLLSETAVRGILPHYTAKLLSAFEAIAQKGKSHPPKPNLPNVPSLPEPLTPREREVLQMIVAGRSNPEIAAQLVIALSTVKTHVKNLYGKLQVTNRVQAVARANDLNLL